MNILLVRYISCHQFSGSKPVRGTGDLKTPERQRRAAKIQTNLSKLSLSAKGFILLLVCLSVSGCDLLLTDGPYERAQPRTPEETAFAKEILNSYQEISFRENREYCGFIGINAEGEFIATKPARGDEEGCQPDEPDPDIGLLASYHTHAAFSDDFDSERPSTDDLEADVAEGIDGYIATPGGRLWFNDAKAGETRMLCGSYCLKHDPRYEPFEDFPIETIYSLDELRERDEAVE